MRWKTGARKRHGGPGPVVHADPPCPIQSSPTSHSLSGSWSPNPLAHGSITPERGIVECSRQLLLCCIRLFPAEINPTISRKVLGEHKGADWGSHNNSPRPQHLQVLGGSFLSPSVAAQSIQMRIKGELRDAHPWGNLPGDAEVNGITWPGHVAPS